MCIQSVFYLWLFAQFFKTRAYIKITLIFKTIIVFVFIINSLYFENIFSDFQSFTYFFSSLLLIITVILFFIEILNGDAILKVKHLLIFWIAVGVLLFQLGIIPVFIAKNYINHSQGLTYGYILLLLNLISSTCFSLGFIWSKKDVKY